MTTSCSMVNEASSEDNPRAMLRREVKTLRTEREILQKATAFFAKETT